MDVKKALARKKAVFNKVIKRFFEVLTIRKTNKTLEFQQLLFGRFTCYPL